MITYSIPAFLDSKPQANPIGPPPTMIMGKCKLDMSKYRKLETGRSRNYIPKIDIRAFQPVTVRECHLFAFDPF
jgi:hypothetical protein